MEKLIILDRDGVINIDSEQHIRTPDEWQPIPKSLEAIALLHHAGYTMTIATNQSGVGRGYFSEATLDAIHTKMLQAVTAAGGQIDSIFYCPHAPDDNCDCRKPKPGLLQQISDHYQVELSGVPFVGDTSRDIKAALAVGAQPVLVQTGKGPQALQKLGESKQFVVLPDLFAFAQWWLNIEKKA